MCGIWAFVTKTKPSLKKIEAAFNKIQKRGPDNSVFKQLNEEVYIGFHRLAIMDPSHLGDQPFKDKKWDRKVYLLCNGEIYNFMELIKKYDLNVKSKSDCEVILCLYMKYGIDVMIRMLDGEFAFTIIDIIDHQYTIYAGRDSIGVRPLFYAFDKENYLGLSSEMKGLVDIVSTVDVFPPGHYMKYDGNVEFTSYYNYIYQQMDLPLDTIYNEIVKRFTNCVNKRMIADRPLGCLLSGGLDSSIVSAVAARSFNKLKTYTIGMEGGTDIPYAKMVAEHIKSDHTIFEISMDEALDAIDETIYAIESFDITTVRASVWQFLVGRKINQNTDVKVILTGEGSDELASGYLYFHKAPSPQEMHEENVKLVKDIHRFDGLRVDRAMAYNGLEVRIPFLDPEFLNFYLSIDPKYRMVTNGLEKYLFRKAFEKTGLLPIDVNNRKKEALSDAVSSHEKSWFQIIQDHINKLITDDEFETNKLKYTHCPPKTKEAYYYRKKFCEYFGDNNCKVIPYFWMPKWSNTTDPSARTLEHYKS